MCMIHIYVCTSLHIRRLWISEFWTKPHVSSPFSGILDLSGLQLLRPHQPLLELAQSGWLHPQKPQLGSTTEKRRNTNTTQWLDETDFYLMKPRIYQGNSPSSILGGRCLRRRWNAFISLLKKLPVNLLFDCLSVHCMVLSVLRLTIVITLACKAPLHSTLNLLPPNGLVINLFNF